MYPVAAGGEQGRIGIGGINSDASDDAAAVLRLEKDSFDGIRSRPQSFLSFPRDLDDCSPITYRHLAMTVSAVTQETPCSVFEGQNLGGIAHSTDEAPLTIRLESQLL